MRLHAFQEKAVAEIEGHRRPCLVAPTGAGKTVIAAAVIDRAPNSHVLFFAHRRELIHQARDKLKAFGVDAGVILAGEPRDHMRRVQVASIQTLASRCLRGSEDLPPAQLVVVDECHHTPANTYRDLLARYPDAQILGMTATPCRRDGRGLGNLFDMLVETPQIEELIKLGHLVGTKVYAPSKPDLTGVRTRHGDYVENQLADRMDRPELVGDIVTHWLRLGERRKSVVFASSIAHSVHIRDEFLQAGVKAEHIDGSTPTEERDEILERLSAGDIELVSNCMVLTEGWDSPFVSCCVLARPTKSMGLFRQMAGRVIRPAEGKQNAIILDHAGAVYAHGFIEDPMQWTLVEDDRALNPRHEARDKSSDSRLLECSQCQAIRTAGRPCGHCGFYPKPRAEYLHYIEGDLAHVGRDGSSKAPIYTPRERQQFYLMLLNIAVERGNNPNSAAHRFREKFNDWPPREWKQLPPIPANDEVLRYDRHCRIRYAKSMQKSARAA